MRKKKFIQFCCFDCSIKNERIHFALCLVNFHLKLNHCLDSSINRCEYRLRSYINNGSLANIRIESYRMDCDGGIWWNHIFLQFLLLLFFALTAIHYTIYICIVHTNDTFGCCKFLENFFLPNTFEYSIRKEEEAAAASKQKYSHLHIEYDWFFCTHFKQNKPVLPTSHTFTYTLCVVSGQWQQFSIKIDTSNFNNIEWIANEAQFGPGQITNTDEKRKNHTIV